MLFRHFRKLQRYPHFFHIPNYNGSSLNGPTSSIITTPYY